MSVGATDTWSQTRDQIINDALSNVGAIGPGESAVGVMRDHAAQALNRVVKSLDPEGDFLWRTTRSLYLTTTAATAAYALDATVFDIDEPMSYLPAAATTSRKMIRAMSRDDFMALPDRTSAGTPSQFMIEKTLTGNGRTLLTATFWPVPDTTADTIEYAAMRRGKDYVTGSDSSDFPTSWIRALVYGLSMELAPSYGQIAQVGVFGGMYEAEKNKQLLADTEHGNMTLVPFGGS